MSYRWLHEVSVQPVKLTVVTERFGRARRPLNWAGVWFRPGVSSLRSAVEAGSYSTGHQHVWIWIGVTQSGKLTTTYKIKSVNCTQCIHAHQPTNISKNISIGIQGHNIKQFTEDDALSCCCLVPSYLSLCPNYHHMLCFLRGLKHFSQTALFFFSFTDLSTEEVK